MKAVLCQTLAAEGADIYAPTLPYSLVWDSTGANETVRRLVADLDEIWAGHKYRQVIFIGHSMGGVLLRRAADEQTKASTLFVDEQHERLARFARLRIFIPLAFSLVALLVLLIISLFWVPLENWRWDPLGSFGDWRWAIWLGALTLFLVIQYATKCVPSLFICRILTALLGVIGGGIAIFIVASLFAQFCELLRLHAAGWAIGATATLALFAVLIRFVLTRF